MEQFEQLKEIVKQTLTQDQIHFGQAISTCSIMVEMGLIRAQLEDIVDGLFDRFGGLIEKDELTETTRHVISFGIERGLLEKVDEESFALSEAGMLMGQDWLMLRNKE